MVAGCGRVSFDARADASTGPTDDSSGADVAFPMGAWTNITQVTELVVGAVNDDPTLTADQLEVYFNSAGNIYTSTRASMNDAWGAPQPLSAVNTAESENTPEVSADGLELFFSRTNPTTADVHR